MASAGGGQPPAGAGELLPHDDRATIQAGVGVRAESAGGLASDTQVVFHSMTRGTAVRSAGTRQTQSPDPFGSREHRHGVGYRWIAA